MTTAKRITAIVALSGLMATSTLAQTQPRDPNMPDPKTTIPEKVDPEGPGTTGSTGQTLSDKLEQSEGVLRPPATGDTEAVVPPAQTPRMPVIKPPGASPGDAVQPK
ncbi:MAG TPA: hypothetical protein VH743_18185 [Beijerinckiaceae bacterium]|jgi:hypothetical protein